MLGEQPRRRRHEFVDLLPVDRSEQVIAGREVTVESTLAHTRLPGDRVELHLVPVRDRGGRAITCPTDVTRPADLQRLVGRAIAEFGQLDVLVSNAGIGKIGPSPT